VGDAKLEKFHPVGKTGKLYGIDSIGNLLPGFPVNYNVTGQWTESSPIVADFDGDGSSDILIGDETHYIRGFSATERRSPAFRSTGDSMPERYRRRRTSTAMASSTW
jgi:hypothetical protein